MIRDGGATTVQPSGTSVHTTAPRSDFGPVANANVAYHHSAGPNQAISPNLGRFSPDLTDGDILVNPASGADAGIAGNVDAMQTMGQR